MQTQLQKEKLIDDFTWKCFEAVSLQDFGENAFPLLDQFLDTSMSLVYRGSEEGLPIPLAGSLKNILPNYSKEFLVQDPIRAALQRYKPKLQKVSLLPEWKNYQRTMVYQEFAKPNHIHDFYHLILGGGLFNGPGMVGIMLARSKKQTSFEEQDGLYLARLLPVLEGMIRRDTLLQSQSQVFPLMETMVELQSPFVVALSLKGRLLWASSKAADLLKLGGKGKKELPQKLSDAAFRFQELFDADVFTSPPPTELTLFLAGDEATRIQLRLMRTHSGEPFLVAEFDPPLFSPQVEKVCHQYDLTHSEAKVFALIAQGMSNRNIAKYLFVSLATVRTHVSRVLGKLGVPSRVQAALLAHGLSVYSEEN